MQRALHPDRLPAVAAFARVAQQGSFSKAARILGVSPSALSQTLRSLETRLGVRLLNRTTRHVSVTEAGALFLQRVLPALEQFDAAFGELEELRGEPKGMLRISLPRIAMLSVMAPLLKEFCESYPSITLDLVADDRFVDLVGEGFDAGMRLGESLAPGMIAVRASRNQRMLVVGSESYFERHGRPQTPAELHRHRCIRFRFSSGGIYRWEFSGEGKEFDMDLDGPLVCNDNNLMLQAARDGVGLAYLFEDLAREDLAAGRLKAVLENWCPSFAGYYLYYPSRDQMPLKLRVLIDFLTARMRV
ncbi:MAG TPA: LysR family transcriptional regulator [Steroidobacteraceae bacterium]|jgi:DNA-binding transcriptional LysR family regulator